MKAIVADLDGTLLKDDKSVSKRTMQAIELMKSRGIYFIIATARPPRNVFDILPLDFSDQILICYNGAEIYRGKSRIYAKSVSSEKVQEIVQRLDNDCPGIRISIEVDDFLYTNFDISIMKNWITPFRRVDFDTFTYKSAAKILVDLSQHNIRDSLQNSLPPECGMIVTDNGTLAHIAHASVSKLNAIKTVAALYNLELADIIAFGDDFNDIEMLGSCGIGYAMGNAPDAIKQAARRIAATNEEDGLAIEVERLLDQNSS